jgi:RNA polymerase sigma-70 factor (ECF subfamily)
MLRPRANRLQKRPEAEAKANRTPSFADVPDEELVARTRSGDRWAEEALFRKHVNFVAALSYRLLRNHEEADDVVQDTFIEALSQLRTLSNPSALRSWLAGIAVHKIHNRFRSQKLRALLGFHYSSHDAALEACAPEGASAEVRAELGLVDDALRVVPDTARAAWILRHVEGFSLEEVARLCGCSLATAKRRIQRAQKSVAAHVDLDGLDVEPAAGGEDNE